MTLFGAVIPFCDHCGIEEVGVVDGATRLRVAVRPHLENNMAIAHGGLLCTLLDVAMGTAARRHAGFPVMTLDMQVSFLSPGRGSLLGEGRVAKAGRSILFCEAVVTREEDGEIVARSTGIFKPVRPRGDAASAPRPG